MAIVTSDTGGALSLGTTSGTNRSISGEFGDPNSDGVFSLNEYQSFLGQSSGNEIAFSDFYGLSASVHSSAFTTTVTDGQYLDESGVWATSGTLATSGENSMVTDDIASWNGRTDVFVYRLINLNSILYLGLKSSGSSTFVNESTADGGFDTLNIYLGQTDNSGSADLSLARTDAVFSTATNQGDWSWGSVAIGTYFGLSSSTTNFFELL